MFCFFYVMIVIVLIERFLAAREQYQLVHEKVI